MRIITRLLSGALSILAPVFCVGATPATPEIMNQVYADYWNEYLQGNPITATFNGDNRFNDRFGPITSAESIAVTRQLAEKYLARTADLDPASLPAEDRISYDLLRYQLKDLLEGLKFPSHLLPLNQMDGMHLLLAQLGSGRLAQPFETVQDYDNWLARAAGFSPYVDGIITDMREGMAKGIVLPKALAKPIIPQLENLGTADLEKTVFLAPLRKFPKEFSGADQTRLTAAYQALVQDKLVPAYQRLLVFMRDTYLPACRDTVALGDLPGGKAWYAYLAHNMTTTDQSPEEIHAVGLREVARIRGLLEEAKVRVGFKGTLKEFFVHLNTAPDLKFKTREEIQTAYEGLRARVEAKVLAFFGRTPKTHFEIRQVESFREVNAPPAQYFQGLPDGSRPGIFYFNAFKPETRTRFTTVAYFVHEAVPGHHFEISLAQEHKSLPDFRRFGGTTAYSEGWGLYSEMLGQEMGLYDDPWQWVGRLSAEIWRAGRLVLDSGIHSKGWTRDQAIAYFLDNIPQGEVVATQEVERYIAIPGQALSYKIGELKLRELRARAEKALGPRFDIRAFHDEVLAHGSVPLSVLESAVDRWIATQKG
jgi:uncharacterized protein (DUF885 family)